MKSKDMWKVKKYYSEAYRMMKDGSLRPRTGWVIECPKGHEVRLTTNFKSFNKEVGLNCPKCHGEWQLLLIPQ